MRKILQLAGFIGAFAFGTLNAQIYLTEGFENPFAGNPAAPTGWTQSRLVLIGDGIPEAATTTGEKDWEQNINTGPATWSTVASSGVYPNAAATGSAALFMNDANFGFNGLGNRRVETPIVNLGASTTPYVRFKMFYSSTGNNLQFRVMASNNGGTTWAPIMSVYPNSGVVGVMTSATPWESINVRIPAIYKVANAKFALEFTPSNGFNNLLFVDDFSVEEFTPTTITSTGSGAWSLPATWVGGVVPNANNNVVIALGHTVTMDMNVERAQNLTLDGGLTYSTTTTAHVLQVLNNFSISATGSYTSGTGTFGKRTYIGSSFNNLGVANFANGTSATGGLFWTGYTGSYSGAGILTSGRIPLVSHICAGGVQYLNPVTVSNGIDLILGTVNVANLTLGNPGLSTTFTTNKAFGSFSALPTINNTNITSRNLNYVTAYATNNVYYVQAPQTIIPGDEIEIISGTRQVTGFLGMNTYNNISLNYPLLVGTTTTGGLTLTRGIIITTNANLLTLNSFATGAVGTIPSTLVTNGTVAGNHGSFISGPVRIFFPPSANTTNRSFPLGVGTAFHNNLPSANLRRFITLGSGLLAWSSQTITATIENAPSGAVNPTLTTVMGSRAYRLNMNGGPGLGVNNTVLLNYDNTTFGPSDNLVGSNQDLRIAQAAALSGPWTERSLTAGTGLIAQNAPGTRVTTSLTPGPINNGDQYFAWSSTSPAIDLSATSLSSPATVGCYGPNQTVSYVITNTGIAPLNFVTNNATITSSVAGAASQVFAPVVINTGVLAVGASQTVVVTTTLNMSAVGTYSFYSTVSTSGDLNLTNDIMTVATRTVIAPLPLPYSQDFNASAALPAGFTNAGTPLYNVFTNHGNTYTDNALSGNLYATTQTISIVNTPKLGALNALSVLSYDYRIQDWSGYPSSAATTTLNWANDSLNVYVSTDCGVTFTLVQSNNAANHTPSASMVTRTVNLGAYSGNNVIVRFIAKKAPAGTGDYYADLDNINITAPIAVDAGALALGAPGLVGCYSSTEPVSITIKNHGINALTNIPVTVVVSGVVNQTLNATYTGTLVATATVNFVVGNINMLAPGTYSFNAFTSMAGDGQPANDAMTQATRTVVAALPLPYSQDFNASLTLPAGFTNAGTPLYSVLANHGNTYTDNALSGNLYSTTQTISIVNLPKLGTVAANTTLKYDYRIQNWSGYPASAATPTANWANDSLNVYVSTNCGLTYTMVQSNNASNHIPSLTMVTKTVNLGSFAGNDVIIRFIAKKAPAGTGDYYPDLDNINICSAPVAPAASGSGVCTGNTATLTTVATGTAQWYATPTSTAFIASGNTFVTPTLTANTTYYLLDSTACGLSTLTPVTITVAAQPTLVIGTSQASVCIGGTLSIGVTGATSYTWSTGANGALIVPTVTATTNYSVIGENAPGCSSTSTVSITGLANPTVSVVSSTSLICVGGTASLTASGASTYSWNTSSTNTVIAISPTVTTTYTVTGTAANSCKNTTTITQSVSACTALNNNGATTIGVLVYPNPNTGLFTIELNNGSVKTIEVMDVTGRIVLANTTSNDKVDFNINTLANGIYYVRIQSNNSIEVVKIVKQ